MQIENFPIITEPSFGWCCSRRFCVLYISPNDFLKARTGRWIKEVGRVLWKSLGKRRKTVKELEDVGVQRNRWRRGCGVLSVALRDALECWWERSVEPEFKAGLGGWDRGQWKGWGSSREGEGDTVPSSPPRPVPDAPLWGLSPRTLPGSRRWR